MKKNIHNRSGATPVDLEKQRKRVEENYKKEKPAFRINAGGKAVFVYPKELEEAGYYKLPTAEMIEAMVWDANKYWGVTKRPRSMFVAEWVLDAIRLGLYSEEEADE